MSDWYPQVCKLQSITPLEGSDFLEITTIMNEYPVILRKGEYKPGDLVSFFPYDTIVPDTQEFHFLVSKENKEKYPVGSVPIKYRMVKAKKIRGTYSEGLVIPAPPNFNENDSIVEYFKLEKRVYEEELPDQPRQQARSRDNSADPKTFQLSKYDLEGLAKYGYAFTEEDEVVIHEKIEGENCCFIYAEDKFWVRSRNFFKLESDDSHWFDVPHRMNVEEKIKPYPNLAFYGELYGAVKHFRYDCPVENNMVQRKFRLFDVYDIQQKAFLDWDQVEVLAAKVGFETAPELYRGFYKTDRSLNALAEGQSLFGKNVKEGWVMRTLKESTHPKLGRKIIKLKGRDYKLFKG